jgi:uncharacterized protein (DUF1778 family)
MDTDLRIPVTSDQKAMIVQAATNLQTDVAAWVRPILMAAAQESIQNQRWHTGTNKKR